MAFLDTINQTPIANEADVETQLVLPMLAALGYPPHFSCSSSHADQDHALRHRRVILGNGFE
jgi:hypothetical protein